MNIKFFCPIWGLVPDYVDKIEAPLEPVLEKIKQAGFSGVEMAVPLDTRQKKELSKLLALFDLELIALQWAANNARLQEYLPQYEAYILSAAELEPLYINCHSGKDYYSYNDNCKVLEKAIELEQRTTIPIIHEIHRGRLTFHPYFIQPYLKAFPELKLAADFSHWCNVCESFLQDQKENINNAIAHTVHIHARVGHTQSCQVPDPRDPINNEALLVHQKWWDAIFNSRNSANAKELTITPEFGPYPYMPQMPYTQEPLANQWEINIWMKEYLEKRYAQI